MIQLAMNNILNREENETFQHYEMFGENEASVPTEELNPNMRSWQWIYGAALEPHDLDSLQSLRGQWTVSANSTYPPVS